jgi:hypothetical protein
MIKEVSCESPFSLGFNQLKNKQKMQRKGTKASAPHNEQDTHFFIIRFVFLQTLQKKDIDKLCGKVHLESEIIFRPVTVFMS